MPRECFFGLVAVLRRGEHHAHRRFAVHLLFPEALEHDFEPQKHVHATLRFFAFYLAVQTRGCGRFGLFSPLGSIFGARGGVPRRGRRPRREAALRCESEGWERGQDTVAHLGRRLR